ncbi:hypothetical protein [Gordonia oryzae]|uniref:hypothetical protein n=1 Tax=Gordonia oryzae TaxID=2487349 RepID=UPI000F4E885F|nr:hypothetical protein [Gordonia oryzae]
MSDSEALAVEQFPVEYRETMIIAYPVIAQMSRNEFYFASSRARDEAFARVLAAKNLRRTHEMFLEDLMKDVERRTRDE